MEIQTRQCWARMSDFVYMERSFNAIFPAEFTLLHSVAVLADTKTLGLVVKRCMSQTLLPRWLILCNSLSVVSFYIKHCPEIFKLTSP